MNMSTTNVICSTVVLLNILECKTFLTSIGEKVDECPLNQGR